MHRQSQMEKKTARQSARQCLPRRQRPHERNTVACGGRGLAGASFRSLANRRRTENIRPHLMARNTGRAFYFENPLCGDSRPRIKGSMFNTQRTRQGNNTTHFFSCLLDDLDHGRTVVSAYYFCQLVS